MIRSTLIPGADLLENCLEAVREMEDSTLCIQGPPGAGKTYTVYPMPTRPVASAYARPYHIQPKHEGNTQCVSE